jgi:hypothetical protein
MRTLDPWIASALLTLCGPALAVEPDPAPAPESSPGWIHELRVGVMAHDVDGLWSGQRKESGFDVGMEVVLSPRRELFSGVIRPNLGFTWHNRGETSKAYAGAVWHWTTDHGFSFEIGLGGAVHTGERETRDPHRKELGSKLLFRTPIEVGYQIAERQRLSLFFEHVSNAWLADENEGMDLVGVRWAFRF